MSAIMFSEQSLAAIKAGAKTQTRRLVDLEKLRVRLPGVVKSDLPACVEREVAAKPGVHHATLNQHGAVTLPALNLGLKPGEFEFLSPYGTGLTTLGGAPGTARRPWVINAPGTVLWVRERWCTSKRYDHLTPKQLPARARIHYLADGPVPRWAGRVVEAVAELRAGLRRRIEERVAAYLDRHPKVPFNDEGWGAISKPLTDTIRAELPPPALKVEVAEATPAERSARVLRMAISAPVPAPPARPWPGPKQVLWLARGGRWVESALEAYRDWWDFLNGHRPGASWAADPWTWVVTFRSVPLPVMPRRKRAA